MLWILAVLTLSLLTAFGGRAKYFGGQSMIDTKGYTTKSWISYLQPLCAAHQVPIEFAASSLDEESGGNPCAIGAPGAVGPDGNPRELGILQLYNPDDLQLLGTTGTEMRAFCVPGKIQVANKRGQLVWSHRQDVARPLTDDEMRRQADLAIRKILQARGYALRYAMDAKLAWPNIELWRLVKLVHGLPGLVQGVVLAANQLGRPPTSWHEYRQLVMTNQVTLDHGTESYRGDFASIFDNAERATSAMQENVA